MAASAFASILADSMTSRPAQELSSDLPPGPGFSATAQAMQWLVRPYDLLRDCAEKLGDTFTLDLGTSGTYVVFSHPQAIRTIFGADPAVLHAGKGNAILKPFLGEASLLLLEEDRHKRERRLLAPAFHPKRIEEYGGLIQSTVLEVTESWSEGQEVVIQEVMQEISLDVILRAVFGASSGGSLGELRQQLLSFLNDSKFNLSLIGQLREDLKSQEAWNSFRQRLASIDGLVRSQIAGRRAEGGEDRSSILSLLLSATDEQGARRSDDELRDEILTLVVAGYETTATALAWALYWIHRTPHVLETASAALTAPGFACGPAELAASPYLEAICKEVLRIRPVIPIVARQVQQPFEIEGLSIRPGITVAPCIYLAHHREAAYPDPDVFRPERFLERVTSPHEYLPFGGGARRCIGLGLALHEMKIVLGTLLRTFELTLVEPNRVQPVRRSVTIAPSGGPLMRVESRISADGISTT